MPATEQCPTSPQPLREIPVQCFVDAFTRQLLLHRGMTTRLLERRIRHRLRVRVVEQTLSAPHAGGDRPLDALPLVPNAPVLFRRTEIVTPYSVVSRNLVVGSLPTAATLSALATSRSVPLGRAIAANGVSHSRTLLTSGLASWNCRGSASPAVTRSYLLRMDGEAPLHVQEIFHPTVASPKVRISRGDEELSASPAGAV